MGDSSHSLPLSIEKLLLPISRFRAELGLRGTDGQCVTGHPIETAPQSGGWSQAPALERQDLNLRSAED